MSPYWENVDYIDLDPFYRKAEETPQTKFESSSFDVIVATEILEHLISPLELIAEGSRLLKDDGLFIITTPNVSHVGAVAKLILGKSNYERLERSPMSLQSDEWRGHIRFYDKEELKALFDKYGLKIVRHQYFSDIGWNHLRRNAFQAILYYIKRIIWIIPIYREGHFAVFKKTSQLPSES